MLPTACEKPSDLRTAASEGKSVPFRVPHQCPLLMVLSEITS